MLEPLLTLLPKDTSSNVAWLAAGGAMIGIVLWLCGSRFSRSLVTLATVSSGALIGLRLPRWFNLPVGDWATAVAGAVVLGVIGYIWHRAWVGLGLAVLLAVWAGLVMLSIHGIGLSVPSPAGITWVEWGGQLWELFPSGLRRAGLAIGAASMGAGVTAAMVWPRAAGYLFYSLLGLSLIIGLGSVAAAFLRPQLLQLAPADHIAQCLTLGGLLLFGAVVQWRMGPRAAAPAPKEQDD